MTSTSSFFRLFVFVICYTLFQLNHVSATSGNDIQKADSLFDMRNDSFETNTLFSDSVVIDKAIQLYQQFVKESLSNSDRHEAIWKTLRAYYFKGTYTTDELNIRRKTYADGIQFGKSYVEEFPNSVEIHGWMGILWAYTGEVNGVLTSARKGVAGKVKYYAEKTIALDSTFLDAGGYRLLGTLHLKVPKIPFLLNWPSKDIAEHLLEKSIKIAPNNLFNQYYMAECEIEHNRKIQAKERLRHISETQEIVHDVAVDAYIKREAEKMLKNLNGAM